VFAGIDSHKDTLAVAVIDGGGRAVTVRQLPNDPAGFTALAALAVEHRVERVGIEGSTNFGWAAAMHLIEAGVTVVEVPPLLTSRERLSRPGQGKTDPVDAVSIARITAREENLPAVRPMNGLPADLRVLMDYHEQLIEERTAIVNRVHSDLGWLRPGYQHRLPRLTSPTHLRAAQELLENDSSIRATVTRARLARLLAIHAELAGLREQITALVQQSGTSLTGIYGIGVFVAARILAEVVDVRRYPSRHAFAAANGSAPIPASSGRTVRHRLIRADTEGRAYYERKRAEGKTSREALRCLKRRLSDGVYRTLRADQAATSSVPLAAAA
jgi:transposase